MARFVARRAVQSALLLVLVMSGVFFLVHLTPGGPEAALVQNPRIGPEEIQRRARAIFAAVAGAQLAARSRSDASVYDEIVATYRESGLIP